MDKSHLDARLANTHLDAAMLLSDAKLLDPATRDTPAFNDPRYLPFYYHLGGQLAPRAGYQIGSKLGLVGACFMRGAKVTQSWAAADAPDPAVRHPARTIESNLSLYCKGAVSSVVLDEAALRADGPPVDVCVLSERFPPDRAELYLDHLWRRLRSEGWLVVDYIGDEAGAAVFHKFCRVKNRQPVVFGTRYGLGVITR
jgi:hypothetical protein